MFYAPLLTCDEDPELVIGRRIVAAIAFIHERALEGVADERFDVRDYGCQRMAIIRIAR